MSIASELLLRNLERMFSNIKQNLPTSSCNSLQCHSCFASQEHFVAHQICYQNWHKGNPACKTYAAATIKILLQGITEMAGAKSKVQANICFYCLVKKLFAAHLRKILYCHFFNRIL